jgi:hypothetical protein
MTIVRHEQVKSVGDVDAWLNERGLSVKDVAITYTYNPRGSKYTIFYEETVDETSV